MGRSLNTQAPGTATRWTITAALVAAGIIHLVASIGILGRDALAGLYRTEVEDSGIELLLQHRAALFGILGVASIAAAIAQRNQAVTLAVNLVSLTTFIALVARQPNTTNEINRVAAIDIALSTLIAVALALWFRTRESRS